MNRPIEAYLALYGEMCRIRAFEEAAAEAQRRKLAFGALHACIGQEAICVGVCANLRRDDVLLSTHRGHGHALAKGADATAMMSEIFGRASGTCGGKGGSMHIADFGVGMLGANGVVAANINIAVGAAQALKMLGSNRIAVSFFGDGAVNRGPFLEGLNWASIYRLPVLFVCEDNGYSAMTRTPEMTAGDGAAARARSLGILTREVDGNDLVAVDAEAARLIEAVRSGAGPRLLHARTYRLSGHTVADPATYRPAGELQRLRPEDPLLRCRAMLAAKGIPEASIEALHEAAEAEMQKAAAAAEQAPWPDASLAFADVQEVGDPGRRAF